MINFIWYIIATLVVLFLSAIIITPIILIAWWIKIKFIKRKTPKDLESKIEEYNKLKKEVEDERKKRRSEVTGDGFRYNRLGGNKTGEPADEIRTIKSNVDKQSEERRRVPIPFIDDSRDEQSEPDNNEYESGDDSETVELHKPADL